MQFTSNLVDHHYDDTPSLLRLEKKVNEFFFFINNYFFLFGYKLSNNQQKQI